MINWISTADPSRKPEPGKPVFIRGVGRHVCFEYAMACVWDSDALDELWFSWNWSPAGYEGGAAEVGRKMFRGLD